MELNYACYCQQRSVDPGSGGSVDPDSLPWDANIPSDAVTAWDDDFSSYEEINMGGRCSITSLRLLDGCFPGQGRNPDGVNHERNIQ